MSLFGCWPLSLDGEGEAHLGSAPCMMRNCCCWVSDLTSALTVLGAGVGAGQVGAGTGEEAGAG